VKYDPSVCCLSERVAAGSCESVGWRAENGTSYC